MRTPSPKKNIDITQKQGRGTSNSKFKFGGLNSELGKIEKQALIQGSKKRNYSEMSDQPELYINQDGGLFPMANNSANLKSFFDQFAPNAKARKVH